MEMKWQGMGMPEGTMPQIHTCLQCQLVAVLTYQEEAMILMEGMMARRIMTLTSPAMTWTLPMKPNQRSLGRVGHVLQGLDPKWEGYGDEVQEVL